ncbi:MAG: ATP synthase F0 subunit C [Candidatus Saccharibacteria bacterium]|nr:ATP synthase F0 subunit C [Candidatus Saccharibacteria bacterium]
MEGFAFGLTYALPAIAAAVAAGAVAVAAMKAAGRNPEKINDLRTMMILGISFIDALAIIAFVVAIVGKVLK